MNPTELLRDALARVTATNEALAGGDVDEARWIARDLERDLERALGEDKRPFVCSCGFASRWPGELERHGFVSGHGLREAA